MMGDRLRSCAVALVCTTVALVGCNPTPESNASPEQSAESLIYPGGSTLEENSWLVEAKVQECMQAAGFEYIARDLQFDEAPTVPRLHSFTAEAARERGFGLAAGFTVGPGPNASDPNDQVVSELNPSESEAWLEALRGATGRPGCRTEAWTSVNGEWETRIEILRAEHQDMVRAIDADPRAVDIERQWGQCMAGEGYGDRDLSGFLAFVESYNDDARQLFEFVGEPDYAEQRQQIIDREAEGALAAVRCADPHRDDYAAVWAEFEADFLRQHAIPSLQS